MAITCSHVNATNRFVSDRITAVPVLNESGAQVESRQMIGMAARFETSIAIGIIDKSTCAGAQNGMRIDRVIRNNRMMFNQF
jgi:phage tail sheath protein FI